MIRIVDLYKSFGPKTVLDGLDLEIRTGETMVVIGQSGSGKSVLLKLLIGILAPDAGTILIDGTNVDALSTGDERQAVTRKFGMLFQGAALFDSMTVAQNVAFGLERHIGPPARRRSRARVTESLEKVGLRGIEHLMPHELSRRDEEAGRAGPGHRLPARDHPLRRAVDGHRPDPGGRDQRADPPAEARDARDLGGHHPRHGRAPPRSRTGWPCSTRAGSSPSARRTKSGSRPNAVVQQFIHGRAEGPIKNW